MYESSATHRRHRHCTRLAADWPAALEAPMCPSGCSPGRRQCGPAPEQHAAPWRQAVLGFSIATGHCSAMYPACCRSRYDPRTVALARGCCSRAASRGQRQLHHLCAVLVRNFSIPAAGRLVDSNYVISTGALRVLRLRCARRDSPCALPDESPSQIIYQSEAVLRTHNPTWLPIELSESQRQQFGSLRHIPFLARMYCAVDACVHSRGSPLHSAPHDSVCISWPSQA